MAIFAKAILAKRVGLLGESPVIAAMVRVHGLQAARGQ
jgi:hypothetical protein